MFITISLVLIPATTLLHKAYTSKTTPQQIVWVDGKFIDAPHSQVSSMTHTLHYGTGVFEGLRFYKTDRGPAIFRLHDHMVRFLHSFSAFKTQVPWNIQTLENAVIKTVDAQTYEEGYIRPLLFFGNESLKLDPRATSVHCTILTMPWGKYRSQKTMRVTVSPFRRFSKHATHIEKKLAGHYVNSIFAHNEAQSRSFDDALMLDDENHIAEGSSANIFFVIDGTLATPSLGSILPGITRDTVIQIAQDMGIPVSEKVLNLTDIKNATEAFFTGTAVEIVPIQSIDEKTFGDYCDTSLTMRISRKFAQIVRGEDEKYASWLTFIRKH
jgi:branched-chain amino acid aminotransferase